MTRPPPLEVEEILDILGTSISTIRELTAGARPHELEPSAYDEEWTIAAVLAHLLACNDVLGGAMLRILREDQPAWRAGSPRTWQAKAGYHGWAFDRLLEALETGRRELLEVIEPATPASWDRTATVTVPPNKVLERSVRYYGDWLAQHERTHIKDLARRRVVAEQTTR